jgi:hypothetical protein
MKEVASDIHVWLKAAGGIIRLPQPATSDDASAIIPEPEGQPLTCDATEGDV